MSMGDDRDLFVSSQLSLQDTDLQVDPQKSDPKTAEGQLPEVQDRQPVIVDNNSVFDDFLNEGNAEVFQVAAVSPDVALRLDDGTMLRQGPGAGPNAAEQQRKEPEPFLGPVPPTPIIEFPEPDQKGAPVMTLPIRPELQPNMGGANLQPTAISVPIGESWEVTLAEFTPILVQHCIKYNIPIDDQEFFDMAMELVNAHQMIHNAPNADQIKVADFLFHQLETRSEELFTRSASHAADELNRSPQDPNTREAILEKHFPGGHYEHFAQRAINLERTMSTVRMNILTEKVEKLIGQEYQKELKAIEDTYHDPKEFKKAVDELTAKIEKELKVKAPDLYAEREYLRTTGVGGIADLSHRALQPHAIKSFYSMLERHVVSNDTDIKPEVRYGPYEKLFTEKYSPSKSMAAIPELAVLGDYASGDLGRIWTIDTMVLKQLGKEVDAYQKIQAERYRIQEQLKAPGEDTGLTLTETVNGTAPTVKTEGFLTVSQVAQRAFGLKSADHVTEAHLDILLKANPELKNQINAEKNALKGYQKSSTLPHFTSVSLDGTTVGRQLMLIDRKEHLQTLLSSRPLEERLPESQHRWRKETLPPTLNPQALVALRTEIETAQEQLTIAKFEALTSHCISQIEETKKDYLTGEITINSSVGFAEAEKSLSEMRTIAYQAESDLEKQFGKPPKLSSPQDILTYQEKLEVVQQLQERIKGLDTSIHNSKLTVASTLLQRVGTMPGDGSLNQNQIQTLRERFMSIAGDNAQWLMRNADLSPKQHVSLAQFSASLVVQRGQMDLAGMESVKERQQHTTAFIQKARDILEEAQKNPGVQESGYRYDLTTSLRNLNKTQETLNSSVLAGSREHAEERYALVKEQLTNRFRSDIHPDFRAENINVSAIKRELSKYNSYDQAQKRELLLRGLETLASAALDADEGGDALRYIRALEQLSDSKDPAAQGRAATLRVQYKLHNEDHIGNDLAAPLARVEEHYSELQEKVAEKQKEVEKAKSDREKEPLEKELQALTTELNDAALTIRKIQAVRVQIHSHLAMAGDRDEKGTHLAILADIRKSAEAADRQAIKDYSAQLETIDHKIELLKSKSEWEGSDPEKREEYDRLYARRYVLRDHESTIKRIRERFPDARDTTTLLEKVSEEVKQLEERRRFARGEDYQNTLDERINRLKDLQTILTEDTSGKDALYIIERESRITDQRLDVLYEDQRGPYRELKELQQQRQEINARIRGHHRSIARLYLQGAAVSIKGGDAAGAEQLILKLKQEYGTAGTMMVFKDMQKAVDDFYRENDKGKWVAGLQTVLHELHGDSLLIEAGVPLAAAGTGAAIGACIGGPPGAGLGFLIGGAVGLLSVKARNLYMGWGRVQEAFDTGLTPLTGKDTLFDAVFTALDVVQIVAPIKGVGALGKAGSKTFVSAAAMSLQETMPELTMQQASRIVRRQLVAEAVKDIAGFGGKAVMTAGMATLVGSVADGFISIYSSDMSPLDKKIATNKMLKQLAKTGTIMVLNMGGESLAVRGATYSSLERTKIIRDVLNGKSTADVARLEARMTETLGKVITELSGDPKLVTDILRGRDLSMPRYESSKIELHGIEGEIRVSSNGRAVSVSDPKLLREMYIDARRTELAEKANGTRTPAEIDLEVRNNTGEIFGYYDRTRDQIVFLDTGSKSRDAQIIRNSRIHHEYKHRQGASEAEAWKAQSDFLNKNGFEMELKDGMVTYRKVPEGQKPTPVSVDQIQTHLKTVYGDIDPNARVQPMASKLTEIEDLVKKLDTPEHELTALRLDDLADQPMFKMTVDEMNRFDHSTSAGQRSFAKKQEEIAANNLKLKERVNQLHDAAGGDVNLFNRLVEDALGPDSANRTPQQTLRAMEELEAIIKNGEELVQKGKYSSWKQYYDEVTAKLDVNDVSTWSTTRGDMYKAALKAPAAIKGDEIESNVKAPLRQVMEDIAVSHKGKETEVRTLINSLYRNNNFKDAMNAEGVNAQRIMTFIVDMHMDPAGKPLMDAFINRHGNKTFLAELVKDPQAFRSHVIHGSTKWTDIEGSIPSQIQTIIAGVEGVTHKPAKGHVTHDGDGYIANTGYRHLVKDFVVNEAGGPTTYRVRWHSKTPNTSVDQPKASMVIERRVPDPVDPTVVTTKYFVPGDSSNPSRWVSEAEWKLSSRLDAHDGKMHLEGFPEGTARDTERARLEGISKRGHIEADGQEVAFPALK